MVDLVLVRILIGSHHHAAFFYLARSIEVAGAGSRHEKLNMSENLCCVQLASRDSQMSLDGSFFQAAICSRTLLSPRSTTIVLLE